MSPPTTLSKASASRKPPTGKKSTPKQPVDPQERIKRLFASLCAQIDGGHFENGLKTCDKILRLAPADKDALQTKLFLLLRTDQYDSALDLISARPDVSGHAFERAYSLYRLHRELEAREILSTIRNEETEHRGALHLEAQLSYRQSNYSAAVDLYDQLLDSAEPQSEEQTDILTNLRSSQTHLDFITTDFLRSLDTLPASLSSSLEISPPPSQPLSSLAAAPAPMSAEAAVPTPKKVRMSRVPKGVIPGVTPPPDPERWLKKSERSTLVKGRRRRERVGVVEVRPKEV